MAVVVGAALAVAQVAVVVLVVAVRARAVVAAQPLDQHADAEREDHEADAGLGAALEPGGQLLLERDQRQADDQQRERVTEAPPGAEAGGGAHVAVVGGHQRADRHEVVGIGGVAQPEHERDRQGDQQRRALDQAREPLVERLDRLEEDVHQRAVARSAGRPFDARRHRGLAEGDAAVVGRQPLGHEHSQAGFAEAAGGALEQPAVLERAAGQDDRSRPRSAARRAQSSAVASASAWWKRVAITPVPRPRETSRSTARIVSRASSTPATDSSG